MVARVVLGVDDDGNTWEPATKVDGLLWISPQLELLVWFSGAWRPIHPTNRPINTGYPPTMPIAVPSWAAVAIVGPPNQGPGNAWPEPGPFEDGQLWFNTNTMRLSCWTGIGFVPIP